MLQRLQLWQLWQPLQVQALQVQLQLLLQLPALCPLWLPSLWPVATTCPGRSMRARCWLLRSGLLCLACERVRE